MIILLDWLLKPTCWDFALILCSLWCGWRGRQHPRPGAAACVTGLSDCQLGYLP